MFHLKKLHPSPHLSHIVKSIWYLERLEVHETDQPLLIVSDGFPELLFSIEKRLIIKYPDGPVLTSGESTFLSQLSSTAEFDAEAGFKGIFVKIYPWVSRLFCHIPQDEIVDALVDQGNLPDQLQWIRSAPIRSLNDDQNILQQIKNSIEKYITETIHNASMTIPPALHWMVKNILSHRGMITIDSASQGINSSRRYVERVFNSYLGLPPDFYNQLIKTKEITRRISSGEFTTYSELSSSFDFYDSAHFCNHFKKKIGMSPSQFKKYMDHFPILEKETYIRQFIYDELAPQ